jgi:protein SCO1/2
VKRLRTFRLVSWAAVAVLAIGLGVVLAERTWFRPAPSPETRAVSGIGGAFSMVDQKGRRFTEADLQGKPTALFFGYTFCPDVCPTTLLEASYWMTELGADADKLRVVFVTVDPERDTPAKLDEFVGSFDPRFIGLSGNREETDRIIKAFRVYARKVDGAGGDYTMDHTAAVYLLDRDARFVGVINFQEETAKALAKIRPLLAAK